jgi:hypothetical protein
MQFLVLWVWDISDQEVCISVRFLGDADVVVQGPQI